MWIAGKWVDPRHSISEQALAVQSGMECGVNLVRPHYKRRPNASRLDLFDEAGGDSARLILRPVYLSRLGKTIGILVCEGSESVDLFNRTTVLCCVCLTSWLSRQERSMSLGLAAGPRAHLGGTHLAI